MSVNFTFNNGGTNTDFDDAFIRKELFTQGGLWLWGNNAAGGLGDGSSITPRSSPIQTVSGGTNWKQVSSGYSHTAAIKTDGTLWMWGYNIVGQLGDNTITNKSSPVQVVGGGTNWRLVASGQYHTLAIKTDGTLWTWGWNRHGQLGDGSSVTHRSSPIQTVSGGTNWKLVAGSIYFTAAIKTDGTLWTWGHNGFGNLGDGSSITHRSSPIQTVAGGTNWKLVSCASYAAAAIKTDGTLWTWGSNSVGQLGDGSVVQKSSPVQTVAGGTNWKQVSCGAAHSAAIKTNGTLWTWGQNFYGQLGDNTFGSKTSPVQTVTGGTNWKQGGGGFLHTAAIKTDGTLWTWGHNGNGNLGDGSSITHRSSPIQTVAGGTNWKQLSSGGFHTVAIREDFY